MFKLIVKKIFTMLRDSYAKKNCLSKPLKVDLFLTKPQDMLYVMCLSWYIFCFTDLSDELLSQMSDEMMQ